VEIPLLVHYLPEGWNLPSYIIAAVQFAIITPVIYALVNKFHPGNIHHREVFMIYFIMSTGFVALLLLTIFWKRTAVVGGDEHSVAALTLIFILAMVDMTSCIVYLPYMSRFKEQYISAYIAGEEATGLITGVTGFIQGAGGEVVCNNVTAQKFNATLGVNITEFAVQVTQKEPRFSVSVFFLSLMFVMLASLVAFTVLNYTSIGKAEMVGEFAVNKEVELVEVNANGKGPPPEDNTVDEPTLMEEEQEETAAIEGEEEQSLVKEEEKAPLSTQETDDEEAEGDKPDEDAEKPEEGEALVQEQQQEAPPEMPRQKLAALCGMLTWCAFFVFGIYPSCLSYSCLPYGSLTYTLALRRMCLGNPTAALIAVVKQVRHTGALFAMIAVSSVLVSYHIVLASMSPQPPLKHSALGSIIVVK
jgi:riboflavin transporter 2